MGSNCTNRISQKIFEASIIVPVYNVEKYLRECLDSILNQTFKDFELILIDDGSKDKSGEICDEYVKLHSNVTVVHQNNQGQAATRNNGVKISKSEWIMFVDSDDVIHPDLLHFLYKAAKETDSGMAVTERVKAKTIPKEFFQQHSFKCSVKNTTHGELEEFYDSKQFFYWAPFPSIIKKSVVQKVPFPEGRIYEDNAVGCQLLYYANTLALVPHCMYFYRENPSGTMNQPLNEKKLDYLWALEEQIKFYEELHYVKMCKKITNELIGSTLYYYARCKKENNDKLLEIVIKDLKRFLKQYKGYIVDNEKSIERKTDRILKPRIYRVKKILKIY